MIKLAQKKTDKTRKKVTNHLFFATILLQKKWECDQCPSTFTDQGNLRRHKLTKHEGATYDCYVCHRQLIIICIKIQTYTTHMTVTCSTGNLETMEHWSDTFNLSMKQTGIILSEVYTHTFDQVSQQIIVIVKCNLYSKVEWEYISFLSKLKFTSR